MRELGCTLVFSSMEVCFQETIYRENILSQCMENVPTLVESYEALQNNISKP